MKFKKILFVTGFFLILFTAKTSFAHHSGSHSVMLHTHTKWEECAMVLDPSLTQSAFGAFIDETSELMYLRPLAGAKPLGKFNFELTVESRSARLEDWKPKWNDTFTHPHHDHWLVGDDHILSIPGLRAKMGVTDKTDIEIFFTDSMGANYGFTGVAVKYAVLGNPDSTWAASVRGSYMTLLGVSDVDLNQVAVDFIVSKDIWLFRPYVGGAMALSKGVETTDKVNLSNETSFSPMALVGTQFTWKYFTAGLEYGAGELSILALKIGATF